MVLIRPNFAIHCQSSRKAKIEDFGIVIAVKPDISWLQISKKYTILNKIQEEKGMIELDELEGVD